MGSERVEKEERRQKWCPFPHCLCVVTISRQMNKNKLDAKHRYCITKICKKIFK